MSAWQKIDPALAWGDIPTAQHHAHRVRKFGIIALCVFVGAYVVTFAVVGALMAAAPY